jgi:leader peptidase (prepilin peptidase)/N-methyltransferase
MLPFHLIMGLLLFAIGSVVGSFLNVCIYRIPFQKSVIWPGSRCPRCYGEIAPRDNIPIVSWFVLRGACRSCGTAIALRYPLVEALVGLLFAATYVTVLVNNPAALWGALSPTFVLALVYDLSLVSLLVAATFIDYDLTIIPDQITVTGMVVGIFVGTLAPGIRPLPGTATTSWGGFGVGLAGLLVGGGFIQSVRVLGSLLFRREAMGFGDVTLLAMIGSYLGWQAAVLSLFLGAFLGLAHAVWKLITFIRKRIRGRQLSSADREIPFGPYLSMAAVILMLSWPWLWPGWAERYFDTLRMLFWFMMGLDT